VSILRHQIEVTANSYPPPLVTNLRFSSDPGNAKSSQQSLNILPLNSIRNVRDTFASRGRKLCGPTPQRQRFAVDFRNKGFYALRIVAGDEHGRTLHSAHP
jgi:hypothetical protein